MKIVINASNARLGGGQTYLVNLLRHLPDDPALEIYIYAPASLEVPRDARVQRLRTSWPTFNPLARAVWERLVLPAELRRLRADILFCPGGVVSTPPSARWRTVTMFRNMIPFDPEVRKQVAWGLPSMRNWLLERVMLKSMASADLVIFISDFARSVIERHITPKHAVTIPHGISAHFRSHLSDPPRPDFLPADEYILYVSRFDVYKHQYEVVSAYDKLPQALKERYMLVLVGESDTACGERVRALIAQRGLERRVLLQGAVKYQLLPSVYRHAGLTLFASSCENCPNILLEAFGAGRPILSSSIMPMPEFGAQAVGYFDPRVADDIAAQMLEVLTNQARADDLAHRAALRSADFDWAITAAKTWSSLAATQAGAPRA